MTVCVEALMIWAVCVEALMIWAVKIVTAANGGYSEESQDSSSKL